MQIRSALKTALMVLSVGVAHGAFAADVPVRKALPPAPVFDWNGFYGGVNVGVGIGQTRGDAPALPGGFQRADEGFSGGAQFGFNWQPQRNWVVGLEADIGWLGIERSVPAWFSAANILGVESEWYGTVRGRIGYTSSPSLFYITGGGAFVNVRNSYDRAGGSAASSSEVATGWTAGWGVETMLGGNWTAKAEYLFIDAGGQSVFNPDAATFFAGYENRFHIFRTGLNYRFGQAAAAPLPAHNWSGPYAGVYGGTVASNVQIGLAGAAFGADLADHGFTGGIQAGYNWQFAPDWTGGFEADLGWLGVDRQQRAEFFLNISHGVETGWYATVRGRIAKSTGPALLYLTGGAAFVDITNRHDHLFAGGAVFVGASRSKVATGWTAGTGIEAVLGNGWTGKAEYLYIDAGSQSVFNPSLADTARFDNRFHVFRFGVNRQFATGAAPAALR